MSNALKEQFKFLKKPTQDRTTNQGGGAFHLLLRHLHTALASPKTRATIDEEALKVLNRMNSVDSRKIDLEESINGEAVDSNLVPLNDDDLLIKAFMAINTPKSLHPRRTLDQFYYYMLEDTEDRDNTQVVEKWVKRHSVTSDGSTVQPSIFMVDQLWLWVIKRKGDDSEIVITSFPERHDEEDDVLQTIFTYLQKKERPLISSSADLVDVVVQHCSNIFDRSKVPERLRFQEFFECSIGEIVG
jgi:hypothetical protein